MPPFFDFGKRGFLFLGRYMRAWILILFCLAVTACSPQRSPGSGAFIATEIGAGAVAGDLRLTDHHGQPRSLQDFHGKVVVVFFGYTHCPDVCPTTMDDLARAVKLLGKHRSEVQVLFVTLDPERDTQQVLAQFVPSFDPAFLGLYGDSAATEAAAKGFRIYYRKQPSGGKGGYTIDHSAGVYVFDKTGLPRLYMNYGQKPQDIAHDLELLL